ncbi:hypothetical protein AC249_AIPGENE21900 [Exaiptasia diaphana]|nr:hypothetical protein AC249_AIPGENE21900 [Exaiptasia diaphana]
MEKRTTISENQMRILCEYHKNGMNCTKKTMEGVIRECSAKVSLSEEQVKHWINNYNASLRRTAAKKMIFLIEIRMENCRNLRICGPGLSASLPSADDRCKLALKNRFELVSKNTEKPFEC